MHHPIRLLSLGSPPTVENQGFLHPHKRAAPRAVNLPVLAGRLPVAGLRRPVRPQAGRILPVTQAEEVPLFLPHLRFA